MSGYVPCTRLLCLVHNMHQHVHAWYMHTNRYRREILYLQCCTQSCFSLVHNVMTLYRPCTRFVQGWCMLCTRLLHEYHPCTRLVHVMYQAYISRFIYFYNFTGISPWSHSHACCGTPDRDFTIKDMRNRQISSSY